MTEDRVTVGSGNVFQDLGLPDSEEQKIKSELLYQVVRAIQAMKLNQKEVGSILGIKQPEVSCLMRAKLSRFSKDRLLDFLVGLGMDIEIVVKNPGRAKSGSKPHPGSLQIVVA